MMEIIDCEKIVKDVRDYHKPWWVINAFHHEDLEKRLEMEGVSYILVRVLYFDDEHYVHNTLIFQKLLLVKVVLDTTVQGFNVDPSLLRDQNDGSPNTHEPSLYQLISNSNVEVGLFWL